MNYSEMLHDFVDNSLATANEETLFQALAADEDLRFELKYLLTLRDTIREDDEAGVVPLASTRSIFSTLGYTAPVAVGAGGGIAASQLGILSLLKSWGGYLMAGLVGTLLATGVFMAVDQDKEIVYVDRTAGQTTPAETATQGQTAGQAPETATLLADRTESPKRASQVAASGSNGIERKAPSGRHVRPITATSTPSGTDKDNKLTAQSTTSQNEQNELTIGAAKKESPKMNAADQTVPSTSTPQNDAIENVDAPSALNTAVRDQALLETTPVAERAEGFEPLASEGKIAEQVDDSPFDPEKRIKRKPATISAHIRGMTLPIDLKSPTLQLPASDPGMENFAIGLAYNLDPNFSFILEGGKESYLLSFRTPKEDGGTFLHEVQPSVVWGAFGIRYNYLTTSSVTPFAQLMFLGGSEAGMMGRGMIGANWNLTDRIGMSAGAEYSLVGYRYRGDLNFSDRFGLTYGLTIDIVK